MACVTVDNTSVGRQILSVTCNRSVVFPSTNKTDRHDIAESGVKIMIPNPSLGKLKIKSQFVCKYIYYVIMVSFSKL